MEYCLRRRDRSQERCRRERWDRSLAPHQSCPRLFQCRSCHCPGHCRDLCQCPRPFHPSLAYLHQLATRRAVQLSGRAALQSSYPVGSTSQCPRLSRCRRWWEASTLILHREARQDRVPFARVPTLSYSYLLQPREEEVQRYLPAVVRRPLRRHRRFFRCPRPHQREQAVVEPR